MKRTLFALAFAAVLLMGCEKKVVNEFERPGWFTNENYFEEKNGMYTEMPLFADNIVFVGDDYIDRGLWNEFYADTTIKNRGITYDATGHVLYRISGIASYKPAKIFVSVGLNDLLHGTPEAEITGNIGKIFATAAKMSPKTELYWLNIVLSPVLDEEQQACGARVNEAVAALASKGGFKVIDANAVLKAGIDGGTFSWDGGKFLNGAGYTALTKAIEEQVGKPSLLEARDHADKLEVSDYYKHRVSMFRAMPETQGKIVMLGNSLNNNALWNELFPFGYVINRGISGDVVDGVHQRLGEVIADAPQKIFVVTATNDFINDTTATALSVWEKYESLIRDIRRELPETTLYIQSTLPLNPKSKFYPGFNERADELNKLLEAGSDRYDYIYLDIAAELSDENGDLRDEYTVDGIHLSAAGYFQWASVLARGRRMLIDIFPTNNNQ
ncbi:MAG: hypothetical protein K6G79_04000 [Bacteroidales bacterium]|nr:hypothetical protein [Bacteroidales bacterium]